MPAHTVPLFTLHFLTGASIIGVLIWGADVVGHHVLEFLIAIGVVSPVSWPASTPIFIMRGRELLTHVLSGGATIALLFAALYAAIQLCLSLGR